MFGEDGRAGMTDAAGSQALGGPWQSPATAPQREGDFVSPGAKDFTQNLVCIDSEGKLGVFFS